MPDIPDKADRIRRMVLAGMMAAAAAGVAGCASRKPGLTPAQIAVLKEQGFIEMPQGWTLDQSTTVLFSINDATLSDAGAHKIARIGKSLQAVQIMHLKVVGYTDSVGSDEYNEALSKRRADAVVAALAEGGFPRAGLESVGMGKRHPIADNRTEAGRAQNRHVSIIVVVD
ncbi:MAG: OmpA family protein [Bordetella sp.]|uniref:OmpA family protein n=1 Tax=Bordetella sp. TaxID=28081 RepID=UPI003F7B7CD4